jgi:serine phosphatase RsbU (regulator of sigma subunit)
MDSINYARHIQTAILPSPDHFLAAFPHSFILYRPKDVVAGDFYWLYEEQTEGTNHVYFAAADCTGHGVPGAMVSVVCSNALNRAVKEFRLTEPGAILDRARELVAETFSRNQEEIRDGMDIALCRLDRNSGELLYSGANNPLWLYTSEGFREIKADKQPVGRSESSKPFTTKCTQLQAGDSIYLFTDGYADQFGGEKGKKFKYSKFRELLSQISMLPPAEQQLRISKELDSWKGRLEQVDDILVLGIRI